MLKETVGHLRDLPRYRQIVATLVKYGYQDVVSALHLEGIVRPLERATFGDGIPPSDRPRRLRMVCEELGPAFIKIGQLLSTRHDLLPESYTAELAQLRENVRPVEFDAIEEILAFEYRRPLKEVFAEVDPTPVAAASISQVHRARTHDGRLIALKIRKPEVDRQVQADLDIMNNLALLAERRIPWLAPYGPVSLAKEFDRTLRRELDLAIERRTMERCRAQFAREPIAHIPEVFPEYSTPRILAMEFIEGVAVDDLDGIRAAGGDPSVVAVRGATILLRQIFRFGFFHADPHPGNLRVLPGGIVAPLDYGMFGRLDIRTRETIVDLLMGLMSEDTDRVIRSLDHLEIRGEKSAAKALRRDVAELVSTYSDLNLDSIDLATLLRDLIALLRSHQLVIPSDLMLLIRSLVTIESVGRRLDPHFDIAAQIKPFFRELTLRRYNPRRLLMQAVRTTEDAQRIATLLPEVLSESLESIKRGELTVKFDLQHFESLVRQLTRASNNLTAGIVIAGLIVGSSLIVHAGVGPTTLGYVGFTLAFVMGLVLLRNMLRP